MTIDPLPTHDSRVVPQPPGGVHLIELVEDEIFMMGWDGEALQPISLYEDSNFIGYTSDQQVPRPFILTPNRTPKRPSVPPGYLQNAPPMTPFILFPEGYGPAHKDVQIVTQSGRVAQPPPIDRSFVGAATREKTTRFYACCGLCRLAYQFGAFWPHLAHIKMHLSEHSARSRLIPLLPQRGSYTF